MMTAWKALMVSVLIGFAAPGLASGDEADDLFREAIRLLAEEVVSSGDLMKEVEIERELETKALDALDRAVTLRPDDPAIRAWRCIAMARLRDERAIEEGESAVRLDPESPLAHRARGLAFEKDKRYDEALVDLDEAIRLAPGDAENFATRAKFHVARERSEKALADFAEAIRLAPRDPGPLVGRGELWLELDKNAPALQDFDEAIRLDPRSTQGHMMRFLVRFKVDDLAGAVEDLGLVLNEFPDDELFAMRGGILAKLNRREEAIHDFSEALRIEPHENLYLVRGSNYEELGRHQDAINDFNQSIALKEKPEAFMVRGQSYDQLGKYAEAIEDYTKALELDPKAPGMRLFRAATFLRSDRPERAIVDLDEQIRDHPDDTVGRYKLAWALLISGRDALASERARSWLDREGFRDAVSTSMVLVAYFADRRAGRIDEADRLARKAVAEGKADAWPYPVLLYLSGAITEGQLLDRAKNDEERAEARLYLGLERLLREDEVGASEFLRWARDHGESRSPEMALARELLRLIGNREPR